MNQFYSTFIFGFVSLFAMVNPIGMSAVFMAMTKEYSKAKRHQTAYLVALYGCILLIATFFIGPYVLHFFGISLASIQVAGGMLVFYAAWNMLDTKPKNSHLEKKSPNNEEVDNTFFPLTMPLTAGAGAIAVTLALAAKLSNNHSFNLIGFSATLLAITLVFITVSICYRHSDLIFNRLGHTGTRMVSSLTAFILLAISVTVIWDGILGFITPLLHP
ncbi:MAG: MarC family protein [Gammaproteobacteria bacterium]|nr:MarC family protein [Gammaproteobacteria bacterium]